MLEGMDTLSTHLLELPLSLLLSRVGDIGVGDGPASVLNISRSNKTSC